MLRRISTKWVLAVLAAVVVPFVGFSWYVNTTMADRLWDVVRYYLQGIAADVADRVDRELEERREDIELLAQDPIVEWVVGDPDAKEFALRERLRKTFDRRVLKDKGPYVLILAVDATGGLVLSNERGSDGQRLPTDVLAELRRRSYAEEPWFREAMAEGIAMVDWHRSDLIPPPVPNDPTRPENYQIGIAVSVSSEVDPDPVGVVYGLVSWTAFQVKILDKVRREYLRGLIGGDIYASSYAWLWKADANTIIAHPRRELYGARVSDDPVGLPQLVDAARSSDSGMYPEYVFNGVTKNAAFKRCGGPDQHGFGWVAGVGIDNNDIYATIDELSRVLRAGTLSILLIALVWTILIARRTTRPILDLQEHTRRVAEGDLETQIHVESRDELGDLARAFNRMTDEIKSSRERLVKAEKDAAWREMARQVAHEIKNPLTPINLSVDLLRRARDEGSPEFDVIFDRTIALVHRQIENMRRIASDFSAFAGARRPEPVDFPVQPLIREILELNAAWAAELGVEVSTAGPDAAVFADRDELRRVLINLVSNALEAMPDGGRLEVTVQREDGRVRIAVRDTGHGLSEEALGRLFEPYFTTRSHGTGLGLAICRRLVEEMNGTIELRAGSPEDGGGTLALVSLPAAERTA